MPSRIYLSDGSFYDIKHPEMVKVEKTKAHVFFHERDEPCKLVLRKAAVSLLHINWLSRQIDASAMSTCGAF
jgi:hypothetical protein